MSAEAAAALMAKAQVFGDYEYLGKKFGKYRLEIQALKFTDKGKPCIEGKVLSAQKTQANEPHAVGTVVSHLEDISDPKKGGAGRLTKALLAILDRSEAEISTAEFTRPDGKIVVAEGENAKRQWLIKMLDQTKQPTAFLQVDVEIEPRPVAAKGDKPAAVFSKEKWSVAELDEKTLDEIEAKRKAANLPSLTDAMK